MSKAVFCIANSESQAEKMVSDLKRSGFRDNDISVLFPDKTGTNDFAHELHSKAPEGAMMGTVTLGIIGGCVGWLVASGSLPIPDMGPFIAAGPFMAMLSCSALGAAVGGIIGALIGRGVPEFVAKRYQGKIRVGNILISVHAGSHENARKAKGVFFKAGCTDVSVMAEAAVPQRQLCTG